jgi:hypothetical protein
LDGGTGGIPEGGGIGGKSSGMGGMDGGGGSGGRNGGIGMDGGRDGGIGNLKTETERHIVKTYHLALHSGDDNDNSIDRFTRDATSIDDLFAELAAEFRADFLGSEDDVDVDENETCLTHLWYENDIPYHHDFYVESD